MLDSAHVIVNNGEGDLEGDLEAYTIDCIDSVVYTIYAYTCKSYCSHIAIAVINTGKFIALALTIHFSFHY